MAKMATTNDKQQETLPGLSGPGVSGRPGADPGEKGVTLVLGPANSGKMGFALRWWEERLARRPVVVVPTGPDSASLNLEMVQRAGALIAQAPAVTFDGLVSHILGRRPRYLSGFQREAILQRLLREIPTGSLKAVSALPGAASALGSLLLELEESGQRPEVLQKALERWRDSRQPDSALAADIARILPAYAAARSELAATDRPGAVMEASERSAGWSRPVVCYGFTSFTPGQRALLFAIAQAAPVLVTLSYERGREVNLTREGEVQEWERAACRVVEMEAQSKSFASPALYFLERNFMRDQPSGESPPAENGPSGVRFLLASGRRNEAELAAQEITALIKEGVAPGSIGVFVRDVAAWRRLLSDALQSCNIPHRVEGQSALAETGLGSAFLNVVNAFVLGRPKLLLSFLRGPYSGVSRDRSADIELAFRRMGSPSVARLVGLVEGRPGEILAEVGSTVGEAEEVRATFDPVPFEALVRSMLGASLAASTVGSREAEEDAVAFGALPRAIGELTGGWVEGPRVWERLLPLVGRIPVSARGAEGEDVVRVLSMQRARARRFQVVFVLGLVEGELPAKRGRSSLLASEQRALLNAAGGGRLLADETEAEDAALFLSVLSRPWQLLYLSARNTDDAGQPAIPSFFWDLARRLTAMDGEPRRRGLADVVYGSCEAPGVRHYLRACVNERREAYPGIPGGRACMDPPRWHTLPGRLHDATNLAELAGQRSFAPSALERYLACPFAWFIDTIVGPRGADQELDGATFGRLAHDVLSATYRDLHSLGGLPIGPDNLDSALEVSHRHIQRVVESGDCPGTAAERRLATWRLRKVVAGLLDRESKVDTALIPAETEVRVGVEGGVDLGGFRVRGRIDRIDEDRSGAALFVIDYKTGELPKPSQLGEEGGLQLPLYLLALAAERPEAEVIGGAYLSLADGKSVGIARAGSEATLGSRAQGCKAYSAEAAAALFQSAVTEASRAAQGMRAGEIPAASSPSSCASFCSLGPVCRSRQKGYRR